MAHYIVEAVVVGAITLVIGTAVQVAFMYTQKGFSIGKISFWPSLLGANFLLGVLVHLICEWSGVNRWYCRNGHACSTV